MTNDNNRVSLYMDTSYVYFTRTLSKINLIFGYIFSKRMKNKNFKFDIYK